MTLLKWITIKYEENMKGIDNIKYIHVFKCAF